MLVTGDVVVTGMTKGLGGPTIIGSDASMMVFNDEIAHALGNVTTPNVPLLSNLLTDLRLDVQETLVEHNLPMDDWFQQKFRGTLEFLRPGP